MKKVLGYGYKLEKESIENALLHYHPNLECLHKTKKGCLETIEEDKLYNNIRKNAKPKIFKVIVEVEE